MKSGLRKRETYNELIHDLEQDPIKHYPNRQATQTENSNYMSQLEGGFHDMMQQNERVVKEKLFFYYYIKWQQVVVLVTTILKCHKVVILVQ